MDPQSALIFPQQIRIQICICVISYILICIWIRPNPIEERSIAENYTSFLKDQYTMFSTLYVDGNRWFRDPTTLGAYVFASKLQIVKWTEAKMSDKNDRNFVISIELTLTMRKWCLFISFCFDVNSPQLNPCICTMMWHKKQVIISIYLVACVEKTGSNGLEGEDMAPRIYWVDYKHWKKPCPCFKISDMVAQKGLY